MTVILGFGKDEFTAVTEKMQDRISTMCEPVGTSPLITAVFRAALQPDEKGII
jgi:hypothetical protein